MVFKTLTAAALCAAGLALAGAGGKVNVQLPNSTQLFPPGDGAAIANSQCLLCHSAEMVLFQPARTPEQWKETINKMRNAYAAPLPAEQVDALAAYLSRVVAVDPDGSR